MNPFFSLFLSLLLVASLSPQGLTETAILANVSVTDPLANPRKDIPTHLSESEIRQRMQDLPDDWTTDGQTLFYTITFTDFVAAIAFVNRLVDPAEKLGHHPDITITYNRVSLQLTTHDASGLTDLDFQLAQEISQL